MSSGCTIYTSPVAWCSTFSCADGTTQLQFTWDGTVYTMCDPGTCELDSWALNWTDPDTGCTWVGVQSGTEVTATVTGDGCAVEVQVAVPVVEMSSIPSSSCSSECCASVASPVPAGTIPDSAWQFTDYQEGHDCYNSKANACTASGGLYAWEFTDGTNVCWTDTSDQAWALMQLDFALTETPLGCQAVTSILGKIPAGTEGTIYLQDHGGIAECWTQLYLAPTVDVTRYACGDWPVYLLTFPEKAPSGRDWGDPASPGQPGGYCGWVIPSHYQQDKPYRLERLIGSDYWEYTGEPQAWGYVHVTLYHNTDLEAWILTTYRDGGCCATFGASIPGESPEGTYTMEYTSDCILNPVESISFTITMGDNQ